MNPEEFRHALSHSATGVTVVTSVGELGDPVGASASAVTLLHHRSACSGLVA